MTYKNIMSIFLLTAVFLNVVYSIDIQMTKTPLGSEKILPSWEYWKDRCAQDDPLGMISGSIANWQITASSTAMDTYNPNCHTNNARPYLPNGMAWCAKFKSASEWIQIDLGVAGVISGVITQGRADYKEWVSSYMISYSDDAVHWRFITDSYNNQKIFEGNTDSHSIRHNYLDEPVIARYIKIHTTTWNEHPSLRFELVGCQPCKQLLGIPPYSRYAASSSLGLKRKSTCRPEFGHYQSNKGWCARRQNLNQWFQIDLGPPTLVTGTIIKGRGDSRFPQYVTRYKLSYSNDSRLWLFYKDATIMDPRIFEGNNEKFPERIHYLTQPFIARYVRFHPIAFVGKIAMRVGLIGCRHQGKCSEGYFKINNQSSCVANLAYRKTAWLNRNSNRHQKRHLSMSNQMYNYNPRLDLTNRHTPVVSDLHNTMIGDPEYDMGDDMASRVVDGYTGLEEDTEITFGPYSTPLDRVGNQSRLMQSDQGYPERSATPKTHQCAVLERKSRYGSNPVLYVDLKEATDINGVVIFTPGQEEDSKRLIARSVGTESEKLNVFSKNLDRLTVYVENEIKNPYYNRMGGQSFRPQNKVCGYVSRTNNAIFNKRLHIPCSQDVRGRYLYVEASSNSRWTNNFAAVLCEIMVY